MKDITVKDMDGRMAFICTDAGSLANMVQSPISITPISRTPRRAPSQAGITSFSTGIFGNADTMALKQNLPYSESDIDAVIEMSFA